MGTIYMNMKNSKANKPHKFFLNLSRRLGLVVSNKDVAIKTDLLITL